MHTEHVGADVPIYAWDNGVRICDASFRQARNISTLPFIHHHVALMADSHPVPGWASNTAKQAADEIERLRRDNDRLTEALREARPREI